ncbi:hypothetical protein [Nocardioides sp. B-3]|uniref:hypothetical protein n=1 Tax=Nocardioides sp. B-3 TaxID=2895565 RepID=UPI0021529238|nr:hypothetical protein [Nocardioides sp. B-3]UUZ59657.1 hypothetical protein LP418_00415 [Nocardioides sp. B-3]
MVEPSTHIAPTTSCATSATMSGSRSHRATPPMAAMIAAMKKSGMFTFADSVVKVPPESNVNRVVAAATAAEPTV